MSLQRLYQLFPDCSEKQKAQLNQLPALYAKWNAKVNLIARTEGKNDFEDHHLIHSLTISHYFNFNPGDTILDLGTGGGFPGIPLAILFPDTHFTLADRVGKKIMTVQAIADFIGLTNVTATHVSAEDLGIQFDHIVCRAVTQLPTLIEWAKILLKTGDGSLIMLKGGDLKDEMSNMPSPDEIHKLKDFVDGAWFADRVLMSYKSSSIQALNH